MPGMSSGVDVSDPTVVAAFKAALLHQGLAALLIFAVLGLALASLRAWLTMTARRRGTSQVPGTSAAVPAEPAGRRLLRIGFGLLWLFDGILQAQPRMPLGLPAQVIEPAAAASPQWVQQVVNWAGTAWSYHPVQAAAAAVWVEAGIGIWMLAAARGAWSRLAGAAGLGWGLAVWVFGESFGGIFVPGQTWLAGTPGAALIYALAGALIALPLQAWQTARLGRLTLAGTGLFLAAMAVLQAWPGRGFWAGTRRGGPGPLTSMIQSVAATRQPRFLADWISSFGSLTAAHGLAVNLIAVTALAVTGAVFLTGQPRLLRPALAAFTVLCLADWVLIQDTGMFGGLGTDPGSMLPFVLLAAGGYCALTRVPAAAAQQAGTGPALKWQDRAALLRRPAAAVSLRSVASAGAVAVIILGAAPMAAAQASPAAGTVTGTAHSSSTRPATRGGNQVSAPDQARLPPGHRSPLS